MTVLRFFYAIYNYMVSELGDKLIYWMDLEGVRRLPLLAKVSLLDRRYPFRLIGEVSRPSPEAASPLDGEGLPLLIGEVS